MYQPPFLARFHRRIRDKVEDRGARPVIIAALGDSVTQGVGHDTEILHHDVYHAQLKRLLEERYPECVFSVLNYGHDGQNAEGGMRQLERDVLHIQPDLLIVGYALNDAVGGGIEGADNYGTAIGTLIERAQLNCTADIIALTPNMMVTCDNPNVPERWKHVTEMFIEVQNSGVLAAYAEELRRVAITLNVLVADVYAEWEKLAASGSDTTAMLLNGLNHPNAEGHRIAAAKLMELIVKHEPDFG